MPGRLDARGRAARERAALEVRRAAALLADGEPLSDAARAGLVALLDQLARDSVNVATVAWDRTTALARVVVDPHRDDPGGAGPLPPGYAPPRDERRVGRDVT